MSERFSREVLMRCSPREILVLAGHFGAAQVARRLGYLDVEQFIKESETEMVGVNNKQGQ